MNSGSEMPAWFWIALIVAWPVFFVTFFWAVLQLLARVGGWRALSKRFPGPPRGETKLAFGTASFGPLLLPVNYNLPVRVSAGDEGVGLALPAPFHIGSPPLFIPWSEIGECRTWKMLGDRFRFTTREPTVKITVRGAAARLLRDTYTRVSPERPLLGSPW